MGTGPQCGDGAGGFEACGANTNSTTFTSSASWVYSAASHGLGSDCTVLSVDVWVLNGSDYEKQNDAGSTCSSGDITVTWATAESGYIRVYSSNANALDATQFVVRHENVIAPVDGSDACSSYGELWYASGPDEVYFCSDPDADAWKRVTGYGYTTSGSGTVFLLATGATLTTPVIQGYTVAGLPGSPSAGQLVVITDASAAGSLTGGGSALTFARWSGSAWVALGDGGSGGGGGAVDSVSGTTNEITCSPTTGTVVCSLASAINISGKTLEIPNGTSAPGTCAQGEVFVDTDATDTQQFLVCTATNTWTAQGAASGSLPTQTGHGNEILTTDGSSAAWEALVAGTGVVITQEATQKVFSTDCTQVACLALDNAFLGNNEFTGEIYHTPKASQTITASTAIDVTDGTFIQITATGTTTITQAPTIADGVDGQSVYIVNVGSNAITIQDESSLASSNLCLTGDANLALAASDAVHLVFSSTAGCWIQVR